MEIINLKSQPQHLEQLAQWHQDEWGYLNPGESLGMRVERMQAYLNQDAIPSMWLAIDGDELIGSAAIDECDMETRPTQTPWLASVFVEPRHRRRGIAATLIKHVLSEAADMKEECLYLFTSDQEAYYQQLGAELITREEYHQEQVSVMCFRL